MRDRPVSPNRVLSPELVEGSPLRCRLACGHGIEIQFLHVLLCDGHLAAFDTGWEYWAIRFRLCGDQLDNRLRFHSEFRGGPDFDPGNLALIWRWLNEFIVSRAFFDCQDIDELLDDVASHLASMGGEDDLVEYFNQPVFWRLEQHQDDDAEDVVVVPPCLEQPL